MATTTTITIVSNGEFAVAQEGDIFNMTFSSRSEPLISSIYETRQIAGLTVISDYKRIIFRATSVMMYPQFREHLRLNNGARRMDYESVLRMVSCLATQLAHLLNKNKCFYALDPNYLVVIDGTKFFYICNEHILDLVPKRGTMLFVKPFPKSVRFASPEVSNVAVIPSEIDHKSIYYSLGKLALFCLYDDDEPDVDMKSIKGTKLYWLLKRCLDEDPHKRSILYI